MLPRASILARVIALAIAVLAAACSDSPRSTSPAPNAPGEWRVYGGSLERTFFNPSESAINKETVGKLVPLWRFRTGAVVTASPILADVELPGEGKTQVLYISSWDG